MDGLVVTSAKPCVRPRTPVSAPAKEGSEDIHRSLCPVNFSFTISAELGSNRGGAEMDMGTPEDLARELGRVERILQDLFDSRSREALERYAGDLATGLSATERAPIPADYTLARL
jgi:hypothetical protein